MFGVATFGVCFAVNVLCGWIWFVFGLIGDSVLTVHIIRIVWGLGGISSLACVFM